MLPRYHLILSASLTATAALAGCSGSDSPTQPPGPPSGSKCTTNCNSVLSGNIAQNRTLYKDTVYTLSGYVKVQSGAKLTIQPGTRVVGDTTVTGSSLWILRGAQIDAQGTADAPIVFTSARSPGNRKPGDWGGIIIVGNGFINRTANPIYTEGPQNGVAENYAGGSNFNDNSGVLKYVRIEFAGYDVSNGQGQELNAISSYAVGRGTTYDYVQAIGGLDDSFEFWGGAVDIRHMVSYESGDDHYDWTEGYSGRGQYLIALQTTVLQPRSGSGTVSSDPRGFEGDGCEIDKAGCTFANKPYSMPVWANFTVIGPGAGVFATTDGNGAVIRRGAGATFVNGVIGRWPGYAVSLRDPESEALRAVDSVMFRNVTLAENGNTFDPVAPTAKTPTFGANLNTPAANFTLATGSAASLFTSLNTASLDFTPSATASIRNSGMASFPASIANRVTGYFGASMQGTTYAGAADPNGPKWWQGWTAYYQN
ncbi:MAG: hypothetical protein ACR2KM_03765 [Gemmatimonadaceae bacterium]